MTVPFHKPTPVGLDKAVFDLAFQYNSKHFTRQCSQLLARQYPDSNIFLAKSCTDALELAAFVSDLQPGDEVILPSFAFVGTANAVANRGAKCVFVDIRKDTLNIDENCIEQAITAKTRAIVTLNYAGVGCNYEAIIRLKKKYGLRLIEDNAQGIGAFYQDKPLGSFGDFGAISFDSMKNLTCGQGGCFILNDNTLLEKVRIAYEFGTNRMDLFEGKTDKYEWKSSGSNYPLAEFLARFLFEQLLEQEKIVSVFLAHWKKYADALKDLEDKQLIVLPQIPDDCRHNGHIFHIRTKEVKDRDALIAFLKQRGITASFHYTPLHSSEFGKKRAEFRGDDKNTLSQSSRLLRLPLYHSITAAEIEQVVQSVRDFFGEKQNAANGKWFAENDNAR